MYKYLLNHGVKNIEYKINTGKEHGIQNVSPEEFNNVDILIIVDSLDLDYTLYDNIHSKGVAIVVLDHHDFETYPDNAILVSSAKNYENPELSGAGVVWKFCAYLDSIFKTNYAKHYIDLAACGILADVCDMSENSMENRYLVNLGLNNLQNKGIKTILESYSFDYKSIAWSIAPLVNAANRTGNNELSIELFLCEDNKRLKQIVKQLRAIKDKQDEIVAESYNLLELQIKQYIKPESKVIFGYVNELEYAGLIANKISSKYQKPTIIFHTIENENRELKGSIRGFGVDNFKDDITNTGLAICAGHPNAAGITIKVVDINKLFLALNKLYESKEFKITHDIDIKLEYNQINEYLINEIVKINRSAGANFKPVTVCLTDIEVMNLSTMKDKRTLKSKHTTFNYYDITFIKWNDTKLYDELKCDNCNYTTVNVVGELQISKFAGRKQIQFIISDYCNVNKFPDFLKND